MPLSRRPQEISEEEERLQQYLEFMRKSPDETYSQYLTRIGLTEYYLNLEVSYDPNGTEKLYFYKDNIKLDTLIGINKEEKIIYRNDGANQQNVIKCLITIFGRRKIIKHRIMVSYVNENSKHELIENKSDLAKWKLDDTEYIFIL